MEIESGAIGAMVVGFLLGLKHATDADHVVAVSTIATEYRNAWRGVWVGASWGLGHTTPLLVLGIVILLLKETVLDRYETMAPVFEFGVGVMLVLLGLQVVWNLRRGRFHIHQHAHDEGPHLHIHGTHAAGEGDEAPHGLFVFGRPFFRMKSFTIGLVHGLAGSAAVMLVLLPEIEGFWVGVAYLVLFGLGTVLSMAAVTVALGVPFALSGRVDRLGATVAGVAGAASLVFGSVLMSDLALGTSLLPF